MKQKKNQKKVAKNRLVIKITISLKQKKYTELKQNKFFVVAKKMTNRSTVNINSNKKLC